MKVKIRVKTIKELSDLDFYFAPEIYRAASGIFDAEKIGHDDYSIVCEGKKITINCSMIKEFIKE